MYTAAEEYFNSSRTAWPPRYIYKSNKKTKMKKNYLAVIRARVYGPTRTFDDDDDDDASPAARPPGVISVFRSLAPVQKSFFFTLSCRRHPAIFFFFSPPYRRTSTQYYYCYLDDCCSHRFFRTFPLSRYHRRVLNRPKNRLFVNLIAGFRQRAKKRPCKAYQTDSIFFFFYIRRVNALIENTDRAMRFELCSFVRHENVHLYQHGL